MASAEIFLFVSHVSEDRDAAMAIVEELERRGLNCWIAPRDVRPGRPFDDEIASAIESSRAMLLVFSEHCNASEYIRREVTFAGESHKVVIPFRIENVQPKHGLRVRLSDLHWLDGFASREKAIDELVRTFPEAENALAPERPPSAIAQPSADEARARRAEERRKPPLSQTRPSRTLSRPALAAAALIALAAIGGAAWLIRPSPTPPPAPAPAPMAASAPSTPAASTPAASLNPPVAAPPVAASPTTAPPPAAPSAEQATIPSAPSPTPSPDAPAADSAPAQIIVTALSPARERALKPQDMFQECSRCPEMIVAPAGAFMMGSPPGEARRAAGEGPQHKVTFNRNFAVGRFAITFDEWDACVADNACWGYQPDSQGWGRGRRPAINVSWNDAKAYLAWLSGKTGKSYRLLSEAEREYVTRAGTTTPFWWGGAITTAQANYNGVPYGGGAKGEYRGRTEPVDSFAPNPWGFFQVHGNIYEWTEDCGRDNYQGAPGDGSAWASGDCGARVIRGGSWDYEGEYLRSASRLAYATDTRDVWLGFRVARSLQTP
jgi:formylglycine-generating enzyme required for sulfatase activity